MPESQPVESGVPLDVRAHSECISDLAHASKKQTQLFSKNLDVIEQQEQSIGALVGAIRDLQEVVLDLSRRIMEVECDIDSLFDFKREITAAPTPDPDHGTVTPEPGRVHIHDVYTAFGESKRVRDWLADERCLVREMTLRKRLNGGMPLEQAMTFLPDRKAILAEVRARRRSSQD